MLLGNWIRLAPYLAIIALLLGSHYAAFRYGGHVALEAVEAQNEEAEDAADDAGDSFDECVASGGVWDFAAGHCRRR